MSIFLSKFLPLFIYPTGLVTVLLVLALVAWKKPRLSHLLLIGAFIVLMVAGNRYVAESLSRTLEWKYPPLTQGTTADGIIVLGGSTEPAIYPRSMVEVNSAADRVLFAARLYQDGAANKIILSGGDIDFLDQSESSPAEDMASLLTMISVPADALIIQNQSRNTAEDAAFSCPIARDAGMETIILVTSAFHMRRSVALFEANGCEVIPAPVDFSITDASWQKLWHPSVEQFLLNLVPSYSHLSTVSKVMKEYFGMWYYTLTGIL